MDAAVNNTSHGSCSPPTTPSHRDDQEKCILDELQSRYRSPRAFPIQDTAARDDFLERLRLAEERDSQAAEGLAHAVAQDDPLLRRTLLRLYRVKLAEWRASDESIFLTE